MCIRDRYQSATTRLGLDRGSLAPNRAIGGDLGVAIQRCPNGEIDDVGASALDDRIDDRAHRVERVRIVRVLGPVLVARNSERLRLESRQSVRRDVSLLDHEAEHEIAPIERALRVTPRRVSRWSLRKRGEHGRLGEIQLTDASTKEISACRLYAVHAIAHVNDVEVQLEDLP